MANSSKKKSRNSESAASEATNTTANVDKLFKEYMDESSGKIGPEGIELLCSHMGVAHTDIRILMLAWKMEARWQGYFTNDEWKRGLKELKADTICKLRDSLSDLQKEIRNSEDFFDLYSFSFRYCLMDEKQKFLDIECICALLELVLGSQYGPQVSSLTEYLQIQQDYKAINMDQWKGFLRFFNEVNFPKLDNYDSTNAWPVILDSYVEWMQEKQS